nr:hypothetical protein Pyn_06004 [Ipomoea batatas]
MALVSSRDILAAVIEQQAEGDGNVEVDSEDVGFNGGAEASGGFEVDKTADERAARGGGGASDNKVKQVSQKGTLVELTTVKKRRFRARKRPLCQSSSTSLKAAVDQKSGAIGKTLVGSI